MSDKHPLIAVLYHIFYEDSGEQVCNELAPLHPYQPVFLFNICNETPGKHAIAGQLKLAFPGCFIIFSSNTGKDIGGKLALLELLLLLDLSPGCLLFLHDKKSLQALKSATWKNDLLKIISVPNIARAVEALTKEAGCGIVATKEYILNEPSENNRLTGMNGPLLETLQKEYNIYPAQLGFVAGTMFWARAAPLLRFFEQHPPLSVRKQLEKDNVIDNFSGTITHSWERLLSWIITADKYLILPI